MKNNQINIVLTLLAILLTLQLSKSDAATDTFVKKVKGSGSVIDAIQTADGNYISLSRPNATWPWTRHIVTKLTPIGKRIWERTLDVQIDDYGYLTLRSIAETGAGYVLVGELSVSDPGETISEGIVVGLNSDGTINWTRRFSYRMSFGGHATTGFASVASALDGGFIVTGHGYTAPFLLLKFDPDGNLQWQKTFSSKFRFLSTDDHGLILAAEVSNGANIVKLDHSGGIVWSKTLAMVGFSLKTLKYDPDHGIVIAGRSKDSNMLSVIRLDSNGQIDWKANYSLESPLSISSVVRTADGGHVVTGETRGNGFLLKIDAQKRPVYQRMIGVRGFKEKSLFIFPTSEGGFVLFGGSGKSDQLFIRVNSDGLVPDCVYFRNLKSKGVSAGPVQVGSSMVSSQPATMNEGLYEVTSISTRHSISTICE